jgi:hypothetical protein
METVSGRPGGVAYFGVVTVLNGYLFCALHIASCYRQ